MSVGDRASALLRNILNRRICMGKKHIVSVTYENEAISIKKNSLCVVHGPIYGRFMGFYVNGCTVALCNNRRTL